MNPARCVLSLDGVVYDPAPLESAEFLERIVRVAAKISGMRILNLTSSNVARQVADKANVFVDEGGISVLALISTSHIALHAWGERRRFMFDLVSCREFDAKHLKLWLVGKLDVKELTHDSTASSSSGLVLASDRGLVVCPRQDY